MQQVIFKNALSETAECGMEREFDRKARCVLDGEATV